MTFRQGELWWSRWTYIILTFENCIPIGVFGKQKKHGVFELQQFDSKNIGF